MSLLFLFGVATTVAVIDRIICSCERCGSWRTFNWFTKMEGNNLHEKCVLHKHVNQYCFGCASHTRVDAFGIHMMRGTRRFRIAQKHCRQSWPHFIRDDTEVFMKDP